MSEPNRRLDHIDVPLAFAVAIIVLVVLAILASGVACPKGQNCANQTPYQEAYNWIWGMITSAAFWTAVFTAILAVATIRLWNSTNRLAEGGEKSSERQLRAYVGLDGQTFEITSVPTGYIPIDPSATGVIYPDFLALKVRNFGATPANEVRVDVGYAVISMFLGQLPDNFDYEGTLRITPRSGRQWLTSAFISRDQTEIVKTPIFDATSIWDARAKKNTLIIFGKIYYTDAFGKKWVTKFCRVYEPWHPPGERFVPVGPFNGEDATETTD